MSRNAGDRFGRYEIVGLVGAGGMGEVYRARDPELERDVAIKILPSDLAADPVRSRRFEREARCIARLGHPNLLAIHDLGRQEGTHFLVCELLEGRTLRERLAAGPLAPREALDYAAQIAGGLAAAHAAGVVHRDLKPENLFLTVDGRAKILDFGLARQIETAGDDEQSTLTAISEQGLVLGTVGYMAPEQVAGRTVDHRADQFALGIVLYEMLAGRAPFRRSTAPETLTAILRDDPEPISRVAPDVPAPIGWIVDRCLARDPGGRYDSTGDLAKELESLTKRLPETVRFPAPAGGGDSNAPPRAPRALPAGLFVVLAAVVGGLAFLAGRARPDVPSIEYRQLTFRRGTVTAARFDPTGEAVLYSAAWDGGPGHIYLDRPQSPDPIPVGPSGSRLLSVSPRGELLLLSGVSAAGPFLSVGDLARMPVTGTPRALAESVTAAAFGPDGELAALVRERDGNAVLEFPPGRERLSTRGMLLDLRLSPEGDRVALAHSPQRGHDWGAIVVLGRDGEEIHLQQEAGRGLAWSASGDELWFVQKPGQTRLAAVSLGGRMRPVATFPTKVFLFDIDRRGRVLLATEQRRYEMAGRQAGGEERDLSWLSWSVPFDLSADGQRILFNECTEADVKTYCHVAVRGFGPEAPVVLQRNDFGFEFSPDGEWVLSSPPWSPQELALLSIPTEDRRTISIESLERTNLAGWLPGGEAILISGNAPGEGDRLYRLELGGGEPVAVTPEGIAFGFFAVSPDGIQVAAPRVEGGIAIYPLDGGEPRTLSLDEQPIRWSADGRSLYTAPLGASPGIIHRIDLADGRLETIAMLAPPDPAGVVQVSPVAITADGSAYVYGYVRNLSELFVVEGLR